MHVCMCSKSKTYVATNRPPPPPQTHLHAHEECENECDCPNEEVHFVRFPHEPDGWEVVQFDHCINDDSRQHRLHEMKKPQG